MVACARGNCDSLSHRPPHIHPWPDQGWLVIAVPSGWAVQAVCNACL